MRYALLALVLVLVGCGPSKEARRDYVQANSRPPAIEQSIIEGKIRVGMTKEDVSAAWGDPRSVNQSYYEGTGAQTQWCYGRGGAMQCVYFEEGHVTGWN
jgi:hypothetical protein